jgi:transposase
MEHVAIDLGGRESQVCVRASTGSIVQERRVRTADLGAYLATRPPSRVIVETCSEAFAVADRAIELGHQVRVVAATLARSLGVGARRTKTDQRDARNLSESSCRMDLPSVHIPSAQSRERKTICGMREGLVHSRTLLINTVRGWMRATGCRVRSGVASSFSQRLRSACPSLPAHVERQLVAIDALTSQIDQADDDLATMAKASAVCRRLMTVPGVGPVTAVRFEAALDRVERFESAHQVEAYLGLTPGEYSSSNTKRRTGITKAGSTAVRWLLVQAAWSARNSKRFLPMVHWSHEVEKRRGKRVAIVALARKLAGILFAIWRDGTIFDPRRGLARPTLSAALAAA